MKFTNQFSNTTPCQSDVAADAWERLEQQAEAEQAHRERMADSAMDYDPHWAVLVDELLEDERLVDLLDALRDHSKGNHRDMTQYQNLAIKLLGIFDDMVVDTIEQKYDILKDDIGVD